MAASIGLLTMLAATACSSAKDGVAGDSSKAQVTFHVLGLKKTSSGAT